ncbi:hypothetical protein QYF36_001521 [Acer negundo]|nr:hypothetical protein QYF36_001521 [Acer negundo]
MALVARCILELLGTSDELPRFLEQGYCPLKKGSGAWPWLPAVSRNYRELLGTSDELSRYVEHRVVALVARYIQELLGTSDELPRYLEHGYCPLKKGSGIMALLAHPIQELPVPQTSYLDALSIGIIPLRKDPQSWPWLPAASKNYWELSGTSNELPQYVEHGYCPLNKRSRFLALVALRIQELPGTSDELPRFLEHGYCPLMKGSEVVALVSLRIVVPGPSKE